MTKANVDNLNKAAREKKISDKPVRDFMSRQLVTISVGTRIYFAVKILQTHKISGAPVVDQSGKLVGIISDYDLLLQSATKDVSEPLEYNKNVHSVSMDTPLKEIIVILYKTKYRRLPVVDTLGKAIGIVSRVDVLMELLDLPK